MFLNISHLPLPASICDIDGIFTSRENKEIVNLMKGEYVRIGDTTLTDYLDKEWKILHLT